MLTFKSKDGKKFKLSADGCQASPFFKDILNDMDEDSDDEDEFTVPFEGTAVEIVHAVLETIGDTKFEWNRNDAILIKGELSPKLQKEIREIVLKEKYHSYHFLEAMKFAKFLLNDHLFRLFGNVVATKNKAIVRKFHEKNKLIDHNNRPQNLRDALEETLRKEIYYPDRVPTKEQAKIIYKEYKEQKKAAELAKKEKQPSNKKIKT